MPAPVTIRLTENFQRNLETIRAFLEQHDAGAAFARLVEDLFEDVIPNLEAFPRLGMDFLNRVPASLQGKVKLADLNKRLGKDVNLRELIFGDYLILYAVRGQELYLLSVKHHLQLSFDLQGHWMR
jgi:plasmid stabilization system protein ParE